MDVTLPRPPAFLQSAVWGGKLSGCVMVRCGVILLYMGEMSAGIVAAVSSSVPEVTAALFFRKDQELRKTIEAYHGHMLSSQKLMTMIDVAETIKNPQDQDKMKQQIILGTLGIAEQRLSAFLRNPTSCSWEIQGRASRTRSGSWPPRVAGGT
jgi:hypothetical protein